MRNLLLFAIIVAFSLHLFSVPVSADLLQLLHLALQKLPVRVKVGKIHLAGRLVLEWILSAGPVPLASELN